MDLLFHAGLIDVGHHGEGHAVRGEILTDETLELVRSDAADRGRRSEYRPAERMPRVQVLLETVVDFVSGGVLVRMYLVDDDTFLRDSI